MASFATLILAAGQSRRFGSPKQLALFRNEPLIVHAIKLARQVNSGVEPWVVLGAHKEDILRDSSVITEAPHCHWVEVADWEKGMGFSIQQGIRAIIKNDQTIDGVLILLADQPLLSRDNLDNMLRKIKPGQPQVLCSVYRSPANGESEHKSKELEVNGLGDSVGVPAYFSSHYFSDLLAMDGDRGAKHLISTLNYVSMDMGNLVDVDYPDDLKAIEA